MRSSSEVHPEQTRTNRLSREAQYTESIGRMKFAELPERLHEQVRKDLRKRAEGGDADAAQALLRTCLGALAQVLRCKKLNRADLASVMFLRDGLNRYLIEGMPLDRALMLKRLRGGAPKTNRMNQVIEIVMLLDQELTRDAVQKSGRPIGVAIKRVAAKLRVSESKVKSAWNFMGSSDGHAKRVARSK